MNSFSGILRTDMRRAIFSKNFCFAILMTLAVLLGVCWGDIKSPATSIVYFVNYGISVGDAVSLFIVIPTFVYASSFVVDKKTGFFPFQRARVSLKNYSFSKFFATGVSGGLALVGGLLVFLVVLKIMGHDFFPTDVEISSNFSDVVFSDLLIGKFQPLYFLAFGFIFFMQGFFWACLGLAVSSVFTEVYITFAAPFVLQFLILQLFWAFPGLPPLLNPVQLGRANIYGHTTVEVLLFAYGYFLFLALVCGAFFYFQLKRRSARNDI